MVYWCMCDEVGLAETYHTHVYLVVRTPLMHTVIESRFPTIHRENVKGTSHHNRDYILKDGAKYGKASDGTYDYTDTSGKQHTGTNYSDTFEEWGEMPHEQQGKSKDAEKILALLADGADNLEIIQTVPAAMMAIDKVDRTRSILRDTEFKKKWRVLDVTYVFGLTGAGKTQAIMEKYGYEACYRVTDYKNPFDSYDGQDVLLFEEFRQDLKISHMLNYLDGYPLQLPCRYFNRQACFTRVYIVTNIPLEDQYKGIQRESPETWQAFIRRIHRVVEYTSNGSVEFPSVEEYMNRWKPLTPYEQSQLPFNK
ncbi:hypothetical protein SDC9_65424 [bioreactor metagenome]|uniref:CRESS-DNA virus Rep endonuclease domain-containing protein n=1 Tax=bioreactor metagenome TaxID=1076179 RepID=A0A644XS08_9ZZZZ